jgi:hypothetical protein
MILSVAIPRSMQCIALTRNPIQDLTLSKSKIRLNSNIGNKPSLDIAVNRFHVDPEKSLEFLGGENFGEFNRVRLSQSA